MISSELELVHILARIIAAELSTLLCSQGFKVRAILRKLNSRIQRPPIMYKVRTPFRKQL